MRTVLKYGFRSVLFLVGMVAFCVLVGEPTEELTMSNVIVMKLLALLGLIGVFKGYMLTLSDKEREEIESEEV